jgi:hypothetical protein
MSRILVIEYNYDKITVIADMVASFQHEGIRASHRI